MADDAKNNAEAQEAANQEIFNQEFRSNLADILGDKDEETCYKELFRILDDSKKGYITNEELKSLFVSIQSDVPMTDQEVDDLLDDIDKNKDGRVDFPEFYKFMLKE